MKRVTLVGLGAIGAVYGSLLVQNSDIELSILVDQQRKEGYQQHPLLLNGQAVPFRYVTPEEVKHPADYVIIATKYGQLEEAMELLETSVGESTCILSLLNGIRSEQDLQGKFGNEKVIYGMCNGLDATRNQHEIVYTRSGSISFGEQNNQTTTKRIDTLATLFAESHISYEIPENMIYTLWYKFMVNVGVNQVSAVTRSPYGVMQKCKKAQKLVRQAMLEVVELSQYEGIYLKVDSIESWFQEVLAPLHPNGKTSMLQDIQQGRRTEVELFSGEVLHLAAKHQVETPINQMLYDLIRTLEFKNQNYPD